MRSRPDSPLPEDGPPTVFALHFLAGTAREWAPLALRLSGRVLLQPIDLPGFGHSADVPGYAVAQMAQRVIERIREQAPRRWALAGHSMGAKVACAIARLSEDGTSGLGGLSHLILLAGSPPGPEPMENTKRQEMLGWFRGSDAERREEAERYIRENVCNPLTKRLLEAAIEDVLAARPAAWAAWLESGSREDWAPRVGTLRTPALIVAGGQDDALGADAQASLMAPHFAISRLEVIPEAGHLLPLERPDELAALMIDFLSPRLCIEPNIGPDYRALIESSRVSARTRQVLLERVQPAAKHPNMLTESEMALLQAVVERIVPQHGPIRIDIAARIVDATANGPGDGWRFADLPSDLEALRAGLRAIDTAAGSAHCVGFASLPVDQQDSLLAALTNDDPALPKPVQGGHFSPLQLKLWFGDICAAATQIYVAHPATQERMGFSGIANRGDATGRQGFIRVGLGERDLWEPSAKTDAPR